VANSRRRERELARRRYERRRMREQELRARRRRRNTIIGASAGTAAVIAGAIALGFVVFGGDDDKVNAGAQPTATATPTPTVSTSAAPAPTGPPKRCAPIAPNPPAKGQPRVPPVTGKVPGKLTVHDVKKGHGRAAAKGDTLSVTYIGISCSTGEVFDASYKNGGQPFEVTPLGQASVIQGWNQGLIGVRTGGVRELVIPPALGYGPTGSGPIKPYEELIFLVTVKSVKAG
jgi:peptidylprolyl isomerase